MFVHPGLQTTFPEFRLAKSEQDIVDRYTEFIAESGGAWDGGDQPYFYGGVVFPADLTESDAKLSYKIRSISSTVGPIS